MSGRFSLARNYRAAAASRSRPADAAGADVIGEPNYFGPGELEALYAGQRVRVSRYGRVVAGEIVRLWAVPPMRDGRRVVRDVHDQTTPDVGARRVLVRVQLVGRTRDVEVKARDLIRAEPRR